MLASLSSAVAESLARSGCAGRALPTTRAPRPRQDRRQGVRAKLGRRREPRHALALRLLLRLPDGEPGASTNADLSVQNAEINVAIAQASRFSRVCRVFAPIYRQVTLVGLAAYPALDVPASYGDIAYDSLLAGFRDYLVKYNNGRPIVFIGHSQGAAILIKLLASSVDNDPALRKTLVLAIILGGDVEVRTGSLDGGSFQHIPSCSRPDEAGCVIAYSSFPGEPPASALFGRPGQGVALQSGQVDKADRQVLCVNPAALAGGAADLDSFFPSEGAVPTPWVEFPGLYSARCETDGRGDLARGQKGHRLFGQAACRDRGRGSGLGLPHRRRQLGPRQPRRRCRLGRGGLDSRARARLNDCLGRQWKSRDGPTAMAKSISSRYSATTFEDGGANGSAPSPRSSRPRTRSTTAERAALR